MYKSKGCLRYITTCQKIPKLGFGPHLKTIRAFSLGQFHFIRYLLTELSQISSQMVLQTFSRCEWAFIWQRQLTTSAAPPSWPLFVNPLGQVSKVFAVRSNPFFFFLAFSNHLLPWNPLSSHDKFSFAPEYYIKCHRQGFDDSFMRKYWRSLWTRCKTELPWPSGKTWIGVIVNMEWPLGCYASFFSCCSFRDTNV